MVNKHFLRKLKKYDAKKLLCWLSSCQAPLVNREKAAKIEYALAVLLTIDYTNEKRNPSRKLMERILLESCRDFEKISINRKTSSMLELLFPIGFLSFRGEAFPWQFANASLERYSPHDEWMEKNLGFTIGDAIKFSKAIMRYSIRKSLMLNFRRNFPPFGEREYYSPFYLYVPPEEYVEKYWNYIITIPYDELQLLVSRDSHKRLDNYLKRMSLDLEKERPAIDNPLDFNIFYMKPLVKFDNEFILPIPRLLWQSLSTTFHYDFLQDKNYFGRYIDEKGKAAERRMITALSRIFPMEELLPRVRYSKRNGWPDVDLVIDNEEATLFLECTAKWITADAKIGKKEAIISDLRNSIEKCHKQLNRAIKACKEGKLGSFKGKKLFSVIVIDDFIPGLEYLLQFCDFLTKPRPYIINIYHLEILCEISEKREFLDFISMRMELSKLNIMFSTDEIDYFLHFKKYGTKYIEILKKVKMPLLYIAHMEELYPDYYRKHFLNFLDDKELASKLSQLTGWERGWS